MIKKVWINGESGSGLCKADLTSVTDKCFKNLQGSAGNSVCFANVMLRLLAVIKSVRFNNLYEF